MPSSFLIKYQYLGDDPQAIADAIRTEQTIEFPYELANARIQNEVVGKIEEITTLEPGVHTFIISYSADVVANELTQFLNVLWGNVSLFPNIRIIDLECPETFISNFKGPRFGVSGLREKFIAPQRPLVTTALKPMGTNSISLSHMAATLVEAGIDVIKDDHSLANQPWSTWRERVTAVSQAVASANSKFNKNTIYTPSLNLPFNQIMDGAYFAKEAGAGGLLILPGITGFDSMRAIAEDDQLAMVIQAHPALLGSWVISSAEGINHGILFGLISRLAGADISIFPHFGGRFSFSLEQCAQIRDATRAPLGQIKSSWVAPAGGMSLPQIPELKQFYGSDTAFLIGGALHRGDLLANANAFVESVRSAE